MPHPHAVAGMVSRLNDPHYARWASQVRATGGCRQPIHLRGRVDHIDPATGELLHRYSTRAEPGGVLRVPCKTRRASRCPACAEVYRADTYQLIRAGLAGGKGVPETVTGHPCLFVTLTAPSFGVVHTRREKNGKVLPCHARRDSGTCPHGRVMSCTARHGTEETRLGEPLCPDCYDYAGSVLFNALSPELWRRFTLALRRRLAKTAGLTVRELREQVTVSFAKVAEYQRRGVVHFHAVIRLDGPDGPTASPPSWATADALEDAVRHAASAVAVTVPAVKGEPARVLRWGAQLDVRPITMGGELTDQAVAGYIAKYATKAAECVGTLDRRISPLDDLDALPLREHARRLITECFRLGALDGLADLRLTQWAHMLGFRGHFSTKSRRYSTTFGQIREERAEHMRAEAVSTGRLPLFDEDTVLVITEWEYAGQGYSLGDALLAAALTGVPLAGVALADPGGR
ncbi:replication initiation protein [Planomonospora parontospora subsp. parontospora]|uniref:Replication initiation protein n=2 Tax=Planomonospora parontospora TaxID=58119 RepID=A0AA37BFJ1_9ACTN|nr:replication initiator [Planomonospora parontospora]GGK62777.1 replication initiation protein [Planomonospora parontospora]GII08293.1 replication initiation protein [Planomonospora parontospora subsp. parontospora]